MKSESITPTLTLPHQGGGNLSEITKFFVCSVLAVWFCSCVKAPIGIQNADLTPAEQVYQFPPGQIKAGVASVEVSPSKPQYLAGFGNNRKSTGIHDPIYARAVVFEQGGQRLALVSIDAIGIQRHHLPQYLEKIKTVPPDRVIIACAHDHSAPDTMGLWGKVYAVSDGRDLEWIEFLAGKVGEAVDAAAQSAVPVELVFGSALVPERGIVRNVREPERLDRELGVIGIYPLGSKIPKAVLVNFAMHAETLWGENTIITSDWPGYMRKRLEEMSGAETALYFNGAQGAMVTIDNLIDQSGEESHTFEEAERVGKRVAQTAYDALSSGERIKNPAMLFARRIFYVPSDNPLYNFFSHTPRITRQFYNGYMQTEVSYIKIGSLEILTFPGEAYPKLGLSVKQKMSGKYKWEIGLANDELGYLLYPEDHYKELYSYEAFTSMSRLWGGILVEKQAVDLTTKYFPPSLILKEKPSREQSRHSPGNINELFDDEALVKEIQRKLPSMLQIAECESSRGEKTGQEVGFLRERIIIALLIYEFGAENIDTDIPSREPEVDVKLFGEPISIKTITGGRRITLNWKSYGPSAENFMETYTPGCDIIFVQLNWSDKGYLYFIPVEVQRKIFGQMGRNSYLKLPKPGTKQTQIEIAEEAIKQLLQDPETKKMEISYPSKTECDPIQKWEEYWQTEDSGQMP